jgi:hypothetical protein
LISTTRIGVAEVANQPKAPAMTVKTHAECAREIYELANRSHGCRVEADLVPAMDAIIARHTRAAVASATKPLTELMESINADLNSMRAVRDSLVEALERAREDMLGWQGYASDYFKEKHDAAADIAAIDEALAQAKGKCVNDNALPTESEAA